MTSAQIPRSGRPPPVTTPEMLPVFDPVPALANASPSRPRCTILAGATVATWPARTATTPGVPGHKLTTCRPAARMARAQGRTRSAYRPGRRPDSRYRPSALVSALALPAGPAALTQAPANGLPAIDLTTPVIAPVRAGALPGTPPA